nr:MAG TPA: hypothetical protein [Caudoviricetes sp.]
MYILPIYRTYVHCFCSTEQKYKKRRALRPFFSA